VAVDVEEVLGAGDRLRGTKKRQGRHLQLLTEEGPGTCTLSAARIEEVARGW
jgi:hypothetical protein